MLRVTRIVSRDQWLTDPEDRVVLTAEERHRRRGTFRSRGAVEFTVGLPSAAPMKDGDGLLLSNGNIILIVAADEPLMEITCDTPGELARVAWNLGGRHLPMEITDTAIRVPADAVVAAMAQDLGAQVSRVTAPFNPEASVLRHGRQHDDHDHDHDHHHGHDHDH